MFTSEIAIELPEDVENTSGTATSRVRPKRADTLSVKERRPRRRRRRGGWKTTTYLTWTQVKHLDGVAHIARRSRRPLNVMLTIRGDVTLPEVQAKRKIQKTIARFGQALMRDRKQRHVGLTVYEKDPHLHAHHLVWIDPCNDDVVARFADGIVIDARPADAGAIRYVTKQRRRLSPDFEEAIDRPWLKSAPIVGARFSLTKDAEALLEAPPRKADRKVPAPAPIVYRENLFDGLSLDEQLAPAPIARPLPRRRLKGAVRHAAQAMLPFDKAPAAGENIIVFLERLGRTHQARAEKLEHEWSASHIGNVMTGQFGASPALIRRVLELAHAA